MRLYLVERAVLHHGTGHHFDRFSSAFARVKNDYYGGGDAYLTDDPEVAKGYAKAGKSRGGKAPQIMDVDVHMKRVFDVDHVYTGPHLQALLPKDLEAFARHARLLKLGDDKHAVLGRLRAGQMRLTGDQLFRGLSDGMVNTAKARELLKRAGYDGLRYNGGLVTGGKRHSAYVVYDARNTKVVGRRPVMDELEAERIQLLGASQLNEESIDESAPLRRIVDRTEPDRLRARMLGKRGKQSVITFECGHQQWANAGEARKGKTYCFDCFYNKPVPEMGKAILREKGLLKEDKFKVYTRHRDGEEAHDVEATSEVSARAQAFAKAWKSGRRDIKVSKVIKESKIAMGQCFSWACKRVRDGGSLVHGTVQNPWSGERYAHAWVEDGDRVYDWQTMEAGSSKYAGKGWPKAEFYKTFSPGVEKRYQPHEATVKSMVTRHYGPWK